MERRATIIAGGSPVEKPALPDERCPRFVTLSCYPCMPLLDSLATKRLSGSSIAVRHLNQEN